jgi:phospholipid/cholesterol/gamma-HCH transport system substrate-binding protein
MRGVRKQLPNFLWLCGMVTVGLAVGAYLLSHQRIPWPSWVPGLGNEYFYVNAELQTAAGVLPGQGNAVTVAGVKIGEIAGVTLRDGKAVLKLRLDADHGHVHPDATVLLRPKTGLKDMVAELDPGRRGAELKDGATLGVGSTAPDVNLDEILAGLDLDTRDALVSLVANAGIALKDGNGRDLAATFKRLEPLSRHAEQASRYVSQRRVKLRRLMGNLSLIAQELGDRDQDQRQFTNSSAAVFRRFAAQNDNLGETLDLLPATLDRANAALTKLDALGTSMKSGFAALKPTNEALGPSLKQGRAFFKATTPVIEKSIRPFAREAQPTAKELIPAAGKFGKAIPHLDTTTDLLNNLLNELAHDPPGDGVHGKSYLYYLPWAAHNTNSVMASQDGIGPIRHTLVLINCDGLNFVESILKRTKARNETLTSVLQLLGAPRVGDVCSKDEISG